MDLVNEVKKKREFKELPYGVVKRAFGMVKEDNNEKEKVKQARIFLRKYFGVFLTNKVLKPKDLLDYEAVLKSHKSSQKRDYFLFYERLQKGLGKNVVGSFVDLGCGANGFSYPHLRYFFGDCFYTGIEASGQLIDNTNEFFDKSGLGKLCNCIHGDLFDLDFVKGILEKSDKERVIFVLQVIDALEVMKKDFSLEFLLMLKKNCEYLVLSLPMKSLSGKKKFEVKRQWIIDFLNKNFEVLDSFEMFDEMFFCLKC